MSRVPSRGGGSGRGRSVLLIVVTVVALAGVAVPAASFTTADVPRGAAVAVTDDANGVVGLDKATRVQAGQVQRLVTVTNRFDTTATVAVSIPPEDGNLSFDTGGTGNCRTVDQSIVECTLKTGVSAEVNVNATKQNGNPKQITYNVKGDAGGTSFRMQDTVGVQNGGGNGGNNGNGNGSGSGNGPGNSCSKGNNPNCN